LFEFFYRAITAEYWIDENLDKKHVHFSYKKFKESSINIKNVTLFKELLRKI